MITLCNHKFKDVTYVKRAYELLSKRNQEKRNLSDYEAKLGKSMYQFLNQNGRR